MLAFSQQKSCPAASPFIPQGPVDKHTAAGLETKICRAATHRIEPQASPLPTPPPSSLSSAKGRRFEALPHPHQAAKGKNLLWGVSVTPSAQGTGRKEAAGQIWVGDKGARSACPPAEAFLSLQTGWWDEGPQGREMSGLAS